MGFFARLGRLWLVIVFIVMAAYLAITNKDRVDIRFPPVIESINMPLYMILGGSFLLGALVAALYFGIEHMRRGLKIRRLERQLALLAPAAPAGSTAAPAVGEIRP